MLLSSSPEKPFDKVWLAAVISPVPVADKAKGDDFDVRSDLDLTLAVTFISSFLNC